VHEGEENGAENNIKVLAELVYLKDKRPRAKVIEILGKPGERETEVLSILKGYGFEDKFPPEVLAAAKKIKYEPDLNRRDLRDLPTVTIDGEDAKDFDDAISIAPEGAGAKLYVHIADVSEYVKLNGAIDKEAFERGTSVYFPGSVFPMLPEELSNGVCSLRPGEEKLTLTAEMTLDREGNVKKKAFYKSTIRSDFRMTYTAVTGIIEGNGELSEKYAPIKEMISLAARYGKILAERRRASGSINFTSSECKILLNKDGSVADISPYPFSESNSLIEQFMVLANESVAKFVLDNNCPSVYRVHEPPLELKIKAFSDFLGAFGYKPNFGNGKSPKPFEDFLESVRDDPAGPVINKFMLRSMQKAKYSPENTGHFGLNSEYYCHFTSPIRRYPDLMMHRALKAILEKKLNPEFKERFKVKCAEASVKSSEREISSEHAEWDVEDYYKAVFMSDKIGNEYEGFVSGVVPAGIFVTLKNTVEGFVSLDNLPEDRYFVDQRNRLAGHKNAFSIGDKVKVIILRADVLERKIDMKLNLSN
jgi:ribonuclease R